MRHLLWILSFTFLVNFSSAWGQKDSLLQSLGVYSKLSQETIPKSDSSLLKSIHKEIEKCIYSDPVRAEYLAHISLQFAQKMGFVNGIGDGLLAVANTQINLQKLDSATYYLDQATAYNKKHDLKENLMESYKLMGNIGYYSSDYNYALEYYFKSLEMADQYYPEASSGKYASVGLVFWTIGNHEKAKTYLEKSNKLGEIYKDTSSRVFALNNLGIVCKNLGEYDQALQYYETGLELAILTNNLRREGEFVYNMANVLFKLGKDEEAFEKLKRSAEITELIGTDRDKAIEYSNVAEYKYLSGNYQEALQLVNKGLSFARSTGYWEVEIEALRTLSKVQYELGNYKMAYEHSREATFLEDSMDLSNVNSDAIALEQAYELEKKEFADSLQRDKELLEQVHQEKLQNQKVQARENLLIVALGVILLVFISLVLLIRTNRKVKQKNEIITERNNQITIQKEEIEEQHQEIKDSITYAQRIQTALISGNEEWDKISLNHYILFKPKDVVSGDFYWAYHSDDDNKSIWVTADCTGHGVPGAFMSMLGIGFLNEIVVENGVREAAEILNRLRAKIINALAQKNSEHQQKDGMDMALCIWDKSTNTLEFSGANNGLYLIRSTEDIDSSKFEKSLSSASGALTLVELKANKMPVGVQSDILENFTSQKIQLKKGDVLISFTDGYADQFGGEKGKKMKYKPFKTELLDLMDKPIKLHANILDEKFDAWKGKLEQIDDVCVIGVQV